MLQSITDCSQYVDFFWHRSTSTFFFQIQFSIMLPPSKRQKSNHILKWWKSNKKKCNQS